VFIVSVINCHILQL